jgi:hypothetical protein
MNPAIIGALIGAIPGTLAAGLTTWASIKSSQFSLQQTNYTLAAEHDRWLRDKRSDVYVDILKFARNAQVRRYRIMNSRDTRIGLKETVRKEVTAEIKDAIRFGLDSYWAPEVEQIVARTYAYASKEVIAAFQQAWGSDLASWSLADDSVEDGYLLITEELRQRLMNADAERETLVNMIVQDLQEHVLAKLSTSRRQFAWKGVPHASRVRERGVNGDIGLYPGNELPGPHQGNGRLTPT